ncbi:Phosphoprotein phosphatase [Bertholletia excelsa]
MPSLKMKTKSTTGCLREKKSLHLCQKSSMISKNPCSRVRILPAEAEFDICIQNSQVPLCNNKVHTQEIATDESIDHHQLRYEENFRIQKHVAPLTDSATDGRMESTQATRTSNLATIFSPVLESIEVHSELEINNNAGCNEGLDMLLLGVDDCENNSRTSCEYQTSNATDLYITDMGVGLPIESNSAFGDVTDTPYLPDYKCDEPSSFFDGAEEYMILPLLEDTMEATSDHDDRTCEDTVIESDDSSLYFAIHQLRSCNEEPDSYPFSNSDLSEHFDPHMFIRNIPDLPDAADEFPPTTLLKETRKMKSVTLVLDLDETLVHSTLEPCDDTDFTFPVFFNMKEHTVYVKQRPYLRMFLERVAEVFEVVVFTASQSIYAEQLLDILDPDGRLISRRAYRESCIFSDGSYTKDLTVLGVDLAKVAIIDNSPQVFRLQVNNGIPIKSWFDDPSDCALVSLLPFLETLVDADDVRPIIAKRFGNKE